MNILCLHRMGDPNNWLESVRTLEYMFADVRHDLNVVVHDSDVPLPSYMKGIDYDLIVLGPTFLNNRYSRKKLKLVFSNYEFIKYSKACKVALPQDDYDCSEILEDWLIDWDVNLVYSVCFEHRFILYPRLNKKGIIRKGYTGYISEDWIDFWKSPKPIEQRSIDVSYRASKLSANFGSLGQLKWEIAERFLKAIEGLNKMKLDISIDPKDWISGKHWHHFLENSKFCLVTASGSSLLDPKGDIRFCANQFVAYNPNASFREIEMKCFAGNDNQNRYTALSPRNIEAALAETVQIATPGTYSELMQPYEHFIPLSEDCSNIKEVIKMMTDMSQIKNIQKKCKETLLSEPRLRRTNIVTEIINFAEDNLSNQRGIVVDQVRTKIAIDRYKAEIKQILNSYFRRRRFLLKAREAAFKLGGKRIYNLIFYNR
jgi:hypothetical protein